MIIALLLVSFVLTLLLQPFLLRMVKEAGFMRENYCHELIPVSMGIIFIFGGFITNILMIVWNRLVDNDLQGYSSSLDEKNMLLLFMAVLAMGLLGLIDDVWGSRSTTGLKGHLLKLVRERQLTTGALKAIGGGFAAFSLSLFLSAGIGELLVNTLLLALCTNAINLLDLRPGRAIKGFCFAIIPVLLLAGDLKGSLAVFSFIGAALAYFPLDVRAKAMMGDAGSNVLGMILGLSIVWNYNLSVRIVVLCCLVVLHLYTEKYSLTKTIEKIPLLRMIDELGRPNVDKRP